jgi:hypothetical protein
MRVEDLMGCGEFSQKGTKGMKGEGKLTLHASRLTIHGVFSCA